MVSIVSVFFIPIILYLLIFRNRHITYVRHHEPLLKLIILLTGFYLSIMSFLYQSEQNLKIKRYENYNYFNKVYADWYKEFYLHFTNQNCKENTITKENFKDIVSEEGKSIIRNYFNIYTQEYYSVIQNFIPQEMWEEVIQGKNCNGAAIRNLARYPFLVYGYEFWANLKHFSFPKDFNVIMKNKIKECQTDIQKYRKDLGISHIKWCENPDRYEVTDSKKLK